jgi:polysaccharide export outer membrane protein
LAETVTAEDELQETAKRRLLQADTTSLEQLWLLMRGNRYLFLSIFGALVSSCLIYCLLAPEQYESTAKVELRGAAESQVIDRREAAPSGSLAASQVQLETVANILRSERLAWDVITRLKLDREREFAGSLQDKFPDFSSDLPTVGAREHLLREFRESLTVESLPHTLVIAIRFRSHDAALSANVVNELVAAYGRQEVASRMQSTRVQTEWLNAQLRQIKAKIDQNDARLAEYQKTNGILSVSETSAGERPLAIAATGALTEIETLSREAANATADRLLREAEYRAAIVGDPELVTTSDQKNGYAGNGERVLLQQLHARRSELELEKAQLEVEHGPNFPRLTEIGKQIEDVDAQMKQADTRFVEALRGAWKTSNHREELVRKSLNDAAREGLKVSGAALTYLTMWEESNANRQVYMRLMQQSEEASLAAGSRGSSISVIDPARQSAKPASPNVLVDMGITVFIALWVSISAVLFKDSVRKKRLHAAMLITLMSLGVVTGRSQAPTPNTSGLPTGVARVPQSVETKSTPNSEDAPVVWDSEVDRKGTGAFPANSSSGQMIDGVTIGPGDMLEVAEAHAPEVHAVVRVSRAGTVTLPLAGEVNLESMDERSAARAIEAALRAKGMLLHPQVTVLVTAFAGKDVSVLGEVARPGVYSYTVHHRLLDLISAASGLSPNAGRLVTISHRSDPESAFAVVLDPSGTDAQGNHNPELMPGDTVQVGRAGLVYVVGDVIRPGGFPVDRSQAITVVQALSLAWGPAQNAALKNAVLIREQAGGRTVTTLNLKRMLRGLDPDLPVRDRDILFVPDSIAKNLLNRSMESVIQSAAGVSIYSGLVYSQRF